MPTVFVDSASASLARGDVVCLVSDAAGMTVVTKAVPAALAAAGFAYGIATAAAAAGARVYILTSGLVASSVTGLAAGSGGRVRVSTAGRCELVSAFQPGDCPVGFLDARGYLSFISTLTLDGDTASISPLGSNQDDWPRLFGNGGLAAAMAYKGKIQLRAGTWLCKSTAACPSGTTLIGSPGTIIQCSLTPLGGPGGSSNCPFTSLSTALRAGTTISGTVAVGSKTVTLASGSAVNVGEYLQLSHQGAGNNVGETHLVVAKAGAVVTLAEPVLYTFVNNDLAQALTVTQDVHIIGNGMRIQGTGDKAGDMGTCIRCSIDNVTIGPDGSNHVFEAGGWTWDIGSREVRISRVHVNGGQGLGVSTPTYSGITIEGTARAALEDCTVTGCNAAGSGFLIAACREWTARNCHSMQNAGVGWQLANGGAATDTEGSRYGTFLGCSSSVNGGTGLKVLDGSSFNTFIGWSSIGDSPHGCIINNPAGGGLQQLGNEFVGCQSVNCAGDAFQLYTGTDQTQITDLVVNGAAGSALLVDSTCTGDTQVKGLFVSEGGTTGNLAAVVMGGTGKLTVSGGTVTRLSNGFWIAFALTGACELRLTDVTVKGGGTGTKFAIDAITGASVSYVKGCKFSTVTFTFLGANIGAKFVDAGSNDMVLGASFSLGATDRANFGQFTANGTTGVVVNGFFPATAPIAISFNTLGGTQGAQPIVSSKSANTFTTKATASDTSVYDWKALV